MPNDFAFDVKMHGPLEDQHSQQNTKAMKCLNNASQFKHFMQHVHEILRDFYKEHLENLKGSEEVEDKLNVREYDFMFHDNDDDDKNESLDRDRTTEPPDSHQDSKESIVLDMFHPVKKHIERAPVLEDFDLDDVLDRLEHSDVECLVAFVGSEDKKFLCHRFAHRSSSIFTKIISAGTDCYNYLLDDDHHDDTDDHLDESHQMTILKLFKERNSKELSVDDVKRLLRLAPDVIDDDFLEELPEEIFKQNLHRLGRLAVGISPNPTLRLALRKRLNDVDLSKLSADDIREMGPGLLSLSVDKIHTLDGMLLLDLDVDDLFKNDDSHEHNSQEELDSVYDDFEDDIKLAIGLRIKEAIRHSGLQKHQLGRSMYYLHHDLDFVYSVDPDDLLDALDDIQNIHYDYEEARSILNHLTQSSHFPPLWMLNGYNLTHIGRLLRGMDTELLSMLNKASLYDALDDISDIDFDDYQAYQLLENMGYTNDSQNYENFDAPQVRRLGKLFRGIPTESITFMKKDIIEDTLDYLDDLDLNDALKNILVEKARHNETISSKFLSLKNFAEVISLDDLDNFDDNDFIFYLNISSSIKWRLSQATVLAHRYKMIKANGHIRPSRLSQMKLLALGLLPDDLHEMITKQDDVFDIAEQLKDIQDDLTSGQIDELVKHFIELSGLEEQTIIIDELEALKGAHILAYLSPELFNKLEFTKAGMIAFVFQVAKMSSHKMSRDHVQFLARIMLDMLEDVDSTEAQNNTSQYRDSQRLRSLGHMVIGLTSSQISAISGKAIIDNLEFLRTLAFTKEQAMAILDKIEDAFKDWRCNINILVRVGPLLLYLEDLFTDDCYATFHEDQLGILLAVLKDFEKRRKAIQERVNEGFTKEINDTTHEIEEKRLVDAIVSVTTQKVNVRKRRTAHAVVGPLNCDILIRLGRSARLVDLQLLKSMSSEELKRCLPQLGAVGDWSQEILHTLAQKLKSIYGGVSTWPAKTSAAAGSIIAGLSPVEIRMLGGLNGVDVMHSVGKHRKLSVEQLKAGFKRWMELSKKKDVSEITSGEFSSLSEFVCGLEAGEIDKLKDTTFKRSLYTIGQSSSCTHEQRQAYWNKALAVYGAHVNQWTPAVLADMGNTLTALNEDHIKMLNSKQLALISPRMIQTLPKDGMAAMSVAQLMSFSTNQANAVTPAQYEALTAEQQKVVSSKVTIDLTKQESTSPGNISGAAHKNLHYGFIIITTVLLVSMLI